MKTRTLLLLSLPLLLTIALLSLPRNRAPGAFAAPAALPTARRVALPSLLNTSALFDPCAPVPGETYGSVAILGAPGNPPAEIHPDVNLAIRGYTVTQQARTLVDYGGTPDPSAPQLTGLFRDNRTATISTVYQVYDWDWAHNKRGALITDWPVTLAGFVVTPTETIHVPPSGYDIGLRPGAVPLAPTGFEVMVLYASAQRITLKYTRDDNVIEGYTIHLENVCVEPTLLALYTTLNAQGRSRLPALRAGQALGRARTSELGAAIRDTGAFMDPRSRRDWWQGR